MKVKLKPTMSWEEASDIIGVEELMKIMGIGEPRASKIFNSKDFPRIPGAGLKADKEAVRLYLQGFKIKENQKNAMEYMILLELRQIRQLFKKGEKDDAMCI